MIPKKRTSPIHQMTDLQVEENLAKTSIHRSVLKKLYPYIASVKNWIFLIIFVEILLVATLFVRPWAVRIILDSTHLEWLNQQKVIIFAIGLLALSWALRFVLSGVSKYFSGRASLKLIND
ncbi:MAG: ABC transporter ATP-binding protein, partial [Acinetobacter sp.]